MPGALISFVYTHFSRYCKTLRKKRNYRLFVNFHITHALFSTLRMDVTKTGIGNEAWKIKMENWKWEMFLDFLHSALSALSIFYSKDFLNSAFSTLYFLHSALWVFHRTVSVQIQPESVFKQLLEVVHFDRSDQLHWNFPFHSHKPVHWSTSL